MVALVPGGRYLGAPSERAITEARPVQASSVRVSENFTTKSEELDGHSEAQDRPQSPAWKK